jgi:hypothetical protein
MAILIQPLIADVWNFEIAAMVSKNAVQLERSAGWQIHHFIAECQFDSCLKSANVLSSDTRIRSLMSF